MPAIALLDDLEAWIREHRPDLRTERTEDGETLRIAEKEREEGGNGPVVDLHARKDEVLLDWTWRLPVEPGQAEAFRTLVLDYVADGIENHGWEVPILLAGGPLADRRMTKPRDDLVGRLMFVHAVREADEPNRAHLYKWHLKKTDEGDYLCRYERTLEGEELDSFFARGPDRTGSFVVIQYGE